LKLRDIVLVYHAGYTTGFYNVRKLFLLQGGWFVFTGFALDAYEASLQAAYDVGNTASTHAVTGGEKVIRAALFKYADYFVLNFFLGGHSHSRRIAYRLDFVKHKKPRTKAGSIFQATYNL
jgi:cytolysin (calcineurin-like family phosphatase)